MISSVACLVNPVLHPFELGVACEVFGLDRSDQGLPGFDFAVCAPTPGPMTMTGGITMSTSYGLDRVASADLVVIPAWHLDPQDDEDIRAALEEVLDRGGTLLTVCSGAFLLAELGLLKGRRATTHWMYTQFFRAKYPDVLVEADRLYVEDGPIITSAGTAAGIDACLFLIRRELGAGVANQFARRMVVPPHRDGGQAQFVETPVPIAEHETEHGLGQVLNWVPGHLDQTITVADLAARAHMAPRTFVRRFTETTGAAPYAWLTRQRVHLAQRLLEEDVELDVEEIARRTGFGNAEALRHHFRRQVHTTPSAYRRTFARRTG